MDCFNICNSTWIFLQGTQLIFVFSILQSFALIFANPDANPNANANSNYQPSAGAIIFPGESPRAVSYQINGYENFDEIKKQNHQDEIQFPSYDKAFSFGRDSIRPSARNKQVHRHPPRRPAADAMQTHSPNAVTYSPQYPQEETGSQQFERRRLLFQNSQQHFARLNNIKKSDRVHLRNKSDHDSRNSQHDNANRRVDNNKDEDNDNTDEEYEAFLRWLKKFNSLDPKKGKATFNISDVIKAASNETSYSLVIPLNDVKCPEGQKMTNDGCKKTVPNFKH